MPIRVEGPRTYVDTFALLYDGSTITLIDEKLTRDIGVRGQSVNLSSQGISNEKIIVNNPEKVDIDVIGSFGKYEIKCAITVKSLKLPTQSIDNNFVLNVPEKERNVKIASYYNSQVKILIGQDNWKLIATRELRQIKSTDIAISRSLLGWSAQGIMSHASKATRAVANIREIAGESGQVKQLGDEADGEETRLDELLKYYFEIDSVGVNVKYD